jgi:hypothetical protein
MREKHTGLTSEHELAKFMVTQLEMASKSQKEAEEELRGELAKRKQQAHQLAD